MKVSVGRDSVAAMTAIATFSAVALDCREPRKVAEFYSAVLDIPIGRVDPDWVQLEPVGGVLLAFQLAPDHVPPQWPSAEHPQQMHLDLDVTDLDAGEAQVLALGARKHEHQPGTTFRVFLDPAGHPFCLCQA
jgi:predicted enzyme related to lactoylglutathione lyase